MDAGAKSRGAVRAVVLSRDPSIEADLPGAEDRVHHVRVASAYEAAAEILAAPTDALVIDLRAFHPRHLRLLEIARKMDAEPLAVGNLPDGTGAEEFSGVRLLARRELAQALRRLVEAEAPTVRPEAPAPAEQPAEETTQARAAGEAIEEFLAAHEADAARKARLVPAKEKAAGQVGKPGKKPAAAPSGRTGEPPEPSGIHPGALLTPGEIAALLENEP